jgi:hypothetical protein
LKHFGYVKAQVKSGNPIDSLKIIAADGRQELATRFQVVLHRTPNGENDKGWLHEKLFEKK